MRVIILALVVIIPLMSATGFMLGYWSGSRRSQFLGLRSLGLSTVTVNRYRDAMRLLSGMVEATNLDGPYGGNILAPGTESEARRIVAGYRREMGISD